jgi:hypothetical protein
MSGIFEFKQCVTIIKSTGKKARNLREFRNALSVVSEGSVFHHTHQYLLKGHMLEYTNDFSQWAGAGLEGRGGAAFQYRSTTSAISKP